MTPTPDTLTHETIETLTEFVADEFPGCWNMSRIQRDVKELLAALTAERARADASQANAEGLRQCAAENHAKWQEAEARASRLLDAYAVQQEQAVAAGECALAAEARAQEAEETAHYANGVADLAMRHRDDAEARAERAEQERDDAQKCINVVSKKAYFDMEHAKDKQIAALLADRDREIK